MLAGQLELAYLDCFALYLTLSTRPPQDHTLAISSSARLGLLPLGFGSSRVEFQRTLWVNFANFRGVHHVIKSAAASGLRVFRASRRLILARPDHVLLDHRDLLRDIPSSEFELWADLGHQENVTRQEPDNRTIFIHTQTISVPADDFTATADHFLASETRDLPCSPLPPFILVIPF